MSAMQRVPSTNILRCSMVEGRAKESVDVGTAGTRRPDSELLIGAITLEPEGVGQMICMKILTVRWLCPKLMWIHWSRTYGNSGIRGTNCIITNSLVSYADSWWFCADSICLHPVSESNVRDMVQSKPYLIRTLTSRPNQSIIDGDASCFHL